MMNSEDLPPVGNTAGATAAKQGFLTVLKNFFSFSGRRNRRKFWLPIIVISIIKVVATIAAIILLVKSTHGMNIPLYFLVTIAIQLFFFLLAMPITIQRLHDSGRSAWYLLLYLVPLFGPVLLLAKLCYSSQQETNKYGPPASTNKKEGILSAVFGCITFILTPVICWAACLGVCFLVMIAISLNEWQWTPYKDSISGICGKNLKNIGTAICAYQEQYNQYLPDGKNLEGFKQLEKVSKEPLAITCDNGKSFAYLGSGLVAPDPRLPVAICISKKHPYKIHFVDAQGNQHIVSVQQHPENYQGAVEEIEKNTIPMNFVDMITLTLTHWIYRLQLDQVRENAKLIDQAAQ